jgi:threonine dehydrogenase-like Zn-dependent dehydrogenase
VADGRAGRRPGGEGVGVASAAATATMSAAVVRGPRRAQAERAALPEPGAGELLLRIEGCGVCASSLPLWEGRPWFDYPLPPGAPGHEAWGRTDDGARVAFLASCGFAEWAAVDAATVVALPPELDGVPFPGEALGCAVNVFRRADVRGGQTVAIVGMGFLGRALAQLCTGVGAEVVEVRRGADVAGVEVERVIETGGVQETLDVASRLVATGGRLTIAGFHQDGPRQVDMQSWNWRGIDVANAHERDQAVVVEGMREAVRLAAAGALEVERLVTHRFPLGRLGDAFEAARTRPAGFVKAWVQP